MGGATCVEVRVEAEAMEEVNKIKQQDMGRLRTKSRAKLGGQKKKKRGREREEKKIRKVKELGKGIIKEKYSRS